MNGAASASALVLAPGAPPGFTVELDALAVQVGLGKEIRAFLIANDFLDCLDITLLGGDEKEVIENVEKAIVGETPAIPWELVDKKRIKKLWTFCKNSAPSPSVSAPARAAASAPDDEEGLPDGVPEAIEKAWIAKHSFHLSGARLLIGGDYNRVYNCLNKKKPIHLPKMDPEKFKLANEGITGESKGLFLGEDGSVSAKKQFYVEVVAHDMLWWRCRAFLSTVAYLTILKPGFFPYQACENFCDALHDVILAPTGSNGRLSLTQCKIAWNSMISAMHVRIFQSDCTLASLTENDMFWKHHWAWHSGSAPPVPSNDSQSSLVRGLQSQIDRLGNRVGGGGGGGGGKRPGGKPTRRGNRDGGGKTGGQQVNTNFNTNVPAPPNGGGDRRGGGGGGGGGRGGGRGRGGQSGGQKSWAKRQKNGRGGK